MFLKNTCSSNASETANLFAEFFKSNYDVAVSSNLVFPSTFNFGNINITHDDVLLGIDSLKMSHKCDVDGFSAFLLKSCKTSLSRPLQFIFNKSLNEGIFLDDWKIAFITPIFKSGNRNNIANYRPISKLTTISKLFESIIKVKIFFHLKNTIIPIQHGFVPNRSTTTNLLVFSEYCFEAFKNSLQVDTIYTDFSKAFDKVSHSILIGKLSSIGLSMNILNWFESYLKKRTSYVCINSTFSDPFVATSGVPQGSVLGPLLFLIFINDISVGIKYAKCLLFADDLKLFLAMRDKSDCVNLQSDLSSLEEWCIKNCLDLNIDKCAVSTYSKLKNVASNSYLINNTAIMRVSTFKDLGVFFDCKFTFASHLTYVISKGYSMLAFVRRNSSHFTDAYTLKLLYCSLVRPIIDYASVIWRPSYANNILRLERIQKSFTRFAIRGLNFSVKPPYNSRCFLLGLKSLEIRMKNAAIMLIADIAMGRIDCACILEKLPFHVSLRSCRRTDLFYLGICRTNYALAAPLYRSLKDVNSIAKSQFFDLALSRSGLKDFLKCYVVLV